MRFPVEFLSKANARYLNALQAKLVTENKLERDKHERVNAFTSMPPLRALRSNMTRGRDAEPDGQQKLSGSVCQQGKETQPAPTPKSATKTDGNQSSFLSNSTSRSVRRSNQTEAVCEHASRDTAQTALRRRTGLPKKQGKGD